MIQGFRLGALSFHGKGKEPAVVRFGPGLNVIHGASNTGKSFIVESIDFMLGGKPPLPDIPERVGYDRVLLSVEDVSTNEKFTLARSHEGGAFRLHTGEYSEVLPTDDGSVLGEIHSDKNTTNLSAWLLQRLGVYGTRIRRNVRNDTNSLSFRALARLVIINEEEIIQKRSPLADGNPTANTANFSTFKFLLTGTDDSALVSSTKTTPEEFSREAQIELLDDIIRDYRRQATEVGGKPDELDEQDKKLSDALDVKEQQLSLLESTFKDLSKQRRTYYKRIEEIDDRLTEISTLLDRFALLDRHYESDLGRLNGIAEAGTLYLALGKGNCPICGTPPESQHSNEGCGGDVESIVAASAVEMAKIERKREELSSTVATLEKERSQLRHRLPSVRSSLEDVASQIRSIVTPDLRRQRQTYSELTDRRMQVRAAVNIHESLADFEARKKKLTSEEARQEDASNSGSEIPKSVAGEFSTLYEETLKGWRFPSSDSAYFDSAANDMVVGNKERTAYGKGLRAITQAAFTITLLRYCKKNQRPHPGFVVIDSPLLSYKEPEGPEDDLQSSGLKEAFYDDLARTPDDRQVIVIENVDPTEQVLSSDQSIEFTGLSSEGRVGFFPTQT